MIKKISITVILFASLLLVNTSCEKWLDVNTNVDAPTSVEGYLYLAGIEQALQGMYWDVRAASGLTQMMGTSGYPNFATHYYYEGSDAGGEIWRMVYWLQGLNLENLINQSVETQQWKLAGIGLALKAFSWDQLAKYHGEIILKDAFVPKLVQFRYDYQNEAYDSVRAWAYRAIEYLEKTDNTIAYNIEKTNANDYIYGGDKNKWIKFAYGVIVRNLASLSNKTDFNTKYATELIDCASKSFSSVSDDAKVTIGGGGSAAAQAAYNNFWGTFRVNLSRSYWQHEYAVQVFTGTVPVYDESTGQKVPGQLVAKQIICDTLKFTQAGHFDPRVVLKLATADDPTYDNMNVISAIKKRKYYGGTSTSVGSAPSFYGRNASSSTITDGKGRWLYRDDAPYILMTYAELKFCLAETYWKLGQTADALTAFKAGVAADLDFTGNYISSGTKGSATGGDKIDLATYNTLKAQYKAGPFVDGLALADFTLSHIMMQKWVALYPWGACEAWVDMRKYHYDLAYTGDYPYNANGWDLTTVDQKWDTNPSKVYKGFFLLPAEVEGRRNSWQNYVANAVNNNGSPCYRIRPRYNSEYMWNKPALSEIKPISGTAVNYQCSIPWFAYPGEIPAGTK